MRGSGRAAAFTKYVLKFKMVVNGFVERNDIVGALFGQLEGILPPELDPQNLLNTGRIGRIEVSVTHREGKTFAEISIPCSLNKVEAAILAAAVETVDKIGPAQAETKLEAIENILEERRKLIVERASSILTSWYAYEKSRISPEKISRLVEEQMKKSRVITYGPEKLPAGIGVLKSDEIIIVEGRADVINLLRYGFDNAIAIGGSGEVPKSIIELSKKKTTTVFVDGDRAGLLLLKSLLQVADIDYVAVAPRGKEVEELTFKEIKKALDNRLPTDKLVLDLEKLEYLLEEYFGKIYRPEKAENVEEILEAKLDKIIGSKRFVVLNEKLEEAFSGVLMLLDTLIESMSSGELGNIYAIVMDAPPSETLLEKLRKMGVVFVAYRSGEGKTVILNLQAEKKENSEAK